MDTKIKSLMAKAGNTKLDAETIARIKSSPVYRQMREAISKRNTNAPSVEPGGRDEV